jgi:UTP--glucose-1-phosphate uridylyltransferase
MEKTMKITKAVITAASKEQNTLPLQKLVDRDGTEKSVLSIIIEETLRAGIEEICVVVRPEDEKSYLQVAGDHSGRLHFVHQKESLGYGHALHCARNFVGDSPVLHLVGDHLNVSRSKKGCAEKVVEVAQIENCTVSAVQPTHEIYLPYFGTVSGRHIQGKKDLYKIDTVIEKPTPTEAEQKLIVPGLRSSYYLCFFGIHVLTPSVFKILEEKISDAGNPRIITLSDALAVLAQKEQYLAIEHPGWRYNLGSKYGLLTAQLAIAMNGTDRDEVLSILLELLALREMGSQNQNADE